MCGFLSWQNHVVMIPAESNASLLSPVNNITKKSMIIIIFINTIIRLAILHLIYNSRLLLVVAGN